MSRLPQSVSSPEVIDNPTSGGGTLRFSGHFPRLETLGVLLAGAAASAVAFGCAYANGWTNLYGDGVAHTAIARKVVDASPSATLWDRYVQFGSPWLPLQHALELPLVRNDALWRSGVAGSVVSMVGFTLGAVFLFRLACLHFRESAAPRSRSELLLPYAALAGWLTSPSLLYVQTTPLTEPLFLAMLVGSVWFLRSWAGTGRPTELVAAGTLATLTALTRYEGWALLPVTGFVVLGLSRRTGFVGRLRDGLTWGAPAAVGPLYWFWHNWAIYGRPLEFLSGTYSASGYFARHRDTLSYLDFAVGHPVFAVLIGLLAAATCAGPLTLICGTLGTVGAAVRTRVRREDIPLFLLLIPPLFTVYGVFSGNIQIYPFFLNVRYGLVALPALALFAPSVFVLFIGNEARAERNRLIVAGVVLGLTHAQNAYVLRRGFFQLAVFREGYRAQFMVKPRESRLLAEFLKEKRIAGTVLMHTGELAPLVADSGLTYARIVHEGTRTWHETRGRIPREVEWIVLRQGDDLDRLLQLHPTELEAFETVWRVGDPALVLMRRKR